MGSKNESFIGVGAVAGGMAVTAGVARGLAMGAALLIDDIGTSLRLAGLAEGMIGAAAVALVALLPDSDLAPRQRNIAFGVAGVVLLLGAFAPGIVSLAVTAGAIGWFYGDRVVQRLPPDAAMSQRLGAAFGSLGTLLGVALAAALVLHLIGSNVTSGMAGQIVMLAFGALIVANIVMKVGFRRTRSAFVAAR